MWIESLCHPDDSLAYQRFSFWICRLVLSLQEISYLFRRGDEVSRPHLLRSEVAGASWVPLSLALPLSSLGTGRPSHHACSFCTLPRQ